MCTICKILLSPRNPALFCSFNSNCIFYVDTFTQTTHQHPKVQAPRLLLKEFLIHHRHFYVPTKLIGLQMSFKQV